jgi:hypothetical protein
LAGINMMYQKTLSNRVTIELTGEDVLFLLSCIETSDRHDLKELANKKLYVRLVQRYVNLVKNGIDLTDTPLQTQNLAN